MKLVDILARELKMWPEHAVIAVQDADKELKFSEELGANIADGRVWIRNGIMGFSEEGRIDELADDFDTAIVTRAEWQAAVDALNAEKVVEWNGEGLPTIGTVCEYWRVHDWQKVEVFAVKPNHNGSHTALFTYENGFWAGCAEPSFFRQIRTPEQIAAEEREKAACELYCTINWHGGVPEWRNQTESRKQDYFKAIDAGYRKQEQK